MAAAGHVRARDLFLCSICQDIFTDPVAIPCGHNFCKSCISEHWRVHVPYQCPMCEEDFDTKPQLNINKFISEMVAQFRHEEQKVEVKKTEAEIEQMIQERQLKILEIQSSVGLSKYAADSEAAKGIRVFTALIKSVQTRLNQLIEEIQETQKTIEKQAKDFIKELEQEICELEKRSTEEEQLSGSEDHLHFDQRSTCVKAAPSMKTWTKVSVHPPSYEGTVERAVSQLEDKLSKDMKKMVAEAELKRVKQYEVDLTLDPDTAYPYLVLSDDGKQVHDGDEEKDLPDNPQRFTNSSFILAKQSFSSGRFYYEVQVKGKTEWALGVVRESIDREDSNMPSPDKGYWTISLGENKYFAFDDPIPVLLCLKSGPQKVGVFVDYEEGQVSFYDVNSSVLIYSFIGCSFNDELLPLFDPGDNDEGENSAPLIITAVDTE